MVAAPLSNRLPRADAERVVALASLIVRAGEKDSLRWWDDDSLTETGGYVLARLFPRDPGRAAVRIAFAAASARHRGVLASAGVDDAVTLLDLAGPLVEESILPPAPLLREPIRSVEELRGRLVELAPKLERLALPQVASQGLLDLSSLAERSEASVVQRATLLAAGYLQADEGRPVYPFIRLSAAAQP